MSDPMNPLRTADFATAKQLLDEGIKVRDAGLVVLALDHPSLIIRRHAAEALGQLGGKADVPHLIAALDQNQVVYGGGTEEVVLQEDLNGALVAALRHLTGEDFGPVDPAVRADVLRVLEASRKWWHANS